MLGFGLVVLGVRVVVPAGVLLALVGMAASLLVGELACVLLSGFARRGPRRRRGEDRRRRLGRRRVSPRIAACLDHLGPLHAQLGDNDSRILGAFTGFSLTAPEPDEL